MSLMYSNVCKQLPTYLRLAAQQRTPTAICSVKKLNYCQQQDSIEPRIFHPALMVCPAVLKAGAGIVYGIAEQKPQPIDYNNGATTKSEARPSSGDEKGPSYDQLQAVHKTLVDSLSNLFIRPMNYKIYRNDLLFIDNIRGRRTTTLYQYVQQAALLRTLGHVKFAYVKFVILNSDISKDEGRITIRWRIVGISGLQVMLQFWKFKLWDWKGLMEKKGTWHDGVSYFDVGPDGLIYRHIADKMMVDKDKEVVTKSAKPILAAGLLASLFPETSLSTPCS